MSESGEEFDFGAALEQELEVATGEDPRSIHDTEEGLLELPYDVQLQILSTLSAVDLLSCCCVNSSFSEIASNEILWRRLYFQRYLSESRNNQPLNSNWKRLYLSRDRDEFRALSSKCGGDFIMLE